MGNLTVVSTKGQVILPKALRDRQNWGPGTRLVIEAMTDGVMLRAAPVFARTRSETVFGSLAYAGPAKTVEEMDAAVAAEISRLHAGG